MTRAPSLRRAALVWMTALLAFVGALGAAAAFRLTYSDVSELLDSHLRQIALNAGGGVRVRDAPPATDQDPEDQFSVTIFTASGAPTFAFGPTLGLPPQRPGFADVEANDESWRVYTAGHTYPIVQVAQQWKVRREVAASAAFTAAAPVLLVIPLSWLVVGWAMNRALRRLDRLVAEIGARGPEAETPVDVAGAPVEIAPLVESFNSLLERLGAAMAAQRRFLADAAHELRTPLAALQIQIDVLRAADSSARETAADALASGVARATALTNQLLNLARLDETTTCRREPVDLSSLLTDCVAELAPLAAARDIDLGLARDAAPSILAAPEELRSLFANLIGNAVKYAKPGGRVDVALRLEGATYVEIVDDGPGVPPEHIARLFERFYRAGSGPAGSGLGLAIARRVADRHGFELTVANRERRIERVSRACDYTVGGRLNGLAGVGGVRRASKLFGLWPA